MTDKSDVLIPTKKEVCEYIGKSIRTFNRYEELGIAPPLIPTGLRTKGQFRSVIDQHVRDGYPKIKKAGA